MSTPDPSVPANEGLVRIIRGVVSDMLADPASLPKEFTHWVPSAASLNRLQHGHDHRNDSWDPIPIPAVSAASSISDVAIRCYSTTTTAISSTSTTDYTEYLTFTVPANDLEVGDLIDITLSCLVTNSASATTGYLVQQIAFGTNTQSVYPTDHFTKWSPAISEAKYMYKLLFQCVDNGGTMIWLSDLRSQWGPYSMGLGTDAPTAGTVTFNALELGSVDLATDLVVAFRGRWTQAPGFGAFGSGANLNPLTARVFRFACRP